MRRIDMRRRPQVSRSTFPSLSLQDYFTYAGNQYGLTPDASFVGFIRQVHQKNGLVAAAVTARALLISQLRFTWRRDRSSTEPGSLFGNRDLAVLERPGPMTRPEMLFLAEEHASYSGSFYAHRDSDRLHILRPDWVKVVIGSDAEPGEPLLSSDAEVVGYTYTPEQAGRKGRMESFLPQEIIHWKPEPDPIEWWRGQSWVTSILREVMGDGQATDHTAKFFEQGTAPVLAFVMDPSLTATQVKEYAEANEQLRAGTRNAWKNMYLGGGADVKPVGADLDKLGLSELHADYELRVAARARVPAAVLGIRYGTQGSALNAGNYAQVRRLWADGWFTPTAQNLCAAFERILPRPDNADLWFDPSEVLFLQEDQKDAAEIASTNAQSIRALVEAGYKPDAAVEAVKNGDLTKLIGAHTGQFSVQLQPPGTNDANAA